LLSAGRNRDRSLKNADRLYAQFKPREALAEPQKILQVDPNHIEALIKTARAHIDVGDQIAEQGADWKERKFKEYKIAEGFARTSGSGDRAVATDRAVVTDLPKSTNFGASRRDKVAS